MTHAIRALVCLRNSLWLVMPYVLVACATAQIDPPAVTPAAIAREQPPEPGAPRGLSIPAPVETTLANGLRVIVVPRHGALLVTTELRVLPAGSATDPRDRFGLAEFAAMLLSRGTQSRSAPQIAAAAQALGGSIDAGVSPDAAHIGMTVITPKVPEAAALLADLVQQPVFAAAEVERHRAQAMDQLRVAMSDPGDLAALVAPQLAFAVGRYRHATGGTLPSLARIRPQDLRRLHSTYYRPDHAVLIFAGDIDAAAAFAIAERSFGQWRRPRASLPGQGLEVPRSNIGRVVVIDLPDAGQAAVIAMRATPARSSPDYYVGLVANAVLGGGYSARLNAEIRIKRGLSYGAFSRIDALSIGGSLAASAQTKNDSANQVVGLVRAEIASLGAEQISTTELAARRANLLGTFARELETSKGLADQLGEFVELNVPVDEINRVVPMASAVTPAQVQAYAAARLAPADLSIVVVGDARLFVDALRQPYPALELIPASELDLESPTLRRRELK